MSMPFCCCFKKVVFYFSQIKHNLFKTKFCKQKKVISFMSPEEQKNLLHLSFSPFLSENWFEVPV